MPFIDCGGAPANCAGALHEEVRSAATRLWHSQRAPGARLSSLARAVDGSLPRAVGRVESAGSFEDSAVSHELAAALPADLRHALSARFEWYRCRGAHFHNDAHFERLLFGVWCVAGPDRDLVFPRVGRRVPARMGSIVVFDPFEPHAVLDPGATRYRPENYEDSAANLFLGFEIQLTASVRSAFGITAPAEGGTAVLSSRVAVHAETGALAPSR